VFFSSLWIGGVEDLDKLKGDDSRPSGLMTFENLKNAIAFRRRSVLLLPQV